jgi:hypothetical protein
MTIYMYIIHLYITYIYSSSGRIVRAARYLSVARGIDRSPPISDPFSQGTDVFASREEEQSGWRRGQRSTLMTKRSAVAKVPDQGCEGVAPRRGSQAPGSRQMPFVEDNIWGPPVVCGSNYPMAPRKSSKIPQEAPES